MDLKGLARVWDDFWIKEFGILVGVMKGFGFKKLY